MQAPWLSVRLVSGRLSGRATSREDPSSVPQARLRPVHRTVERCGRGARASVRRCPSLPPLPFSAVAGSVAAATTTHPCRLRWRPLWARGPPRRWLAVPLPSRPLSTSSAGARFDAFAKENGRRGGGGGGDGESTDAVAPLWSPRSAASASDSYKREYFEWSPPKSALASAAAAAAAAAAARQRAAGDRRCSGGRRGRKAQCGGGRDQPPREPHARRPARARLATGRGGRGRGSARVARRPARRGSTAGKKGKGKTPPPAGRAPATHAAGGVTAGPTGGGGGGGAAAAADARAGRRPWRVAQGGAGRFLWLLCRGSSSSAPAIEQERT